MITANSTSVPAVPKCMVPLQQTFGAELSYDNFYVGKSGQRLGITEEDLHSAGLTDDTLWIHENMILPLEKALALMKDHGYGLRIRDAWRPASLYDTISGRMRSRGNDKVSLLNTESKPHATGMAIDAVPTDSEGEVLWTRNEPRDGKDSCIFGFYSTSAHPDAPLYRDRQKILVWSFISAGFHLGSKREYWHFELGACSYSKRW